MMRVKICGITNIDDARCAAGAGADLMGFIFFHKSPRYVTPRSAAAITWAIRDEYGPSAPQFVGVFVNEALEHVRHVIEAAGLDLAQLHGDEPPELVRSLGCRAFKAVRPRTREQAEAAAATYGNIFVEDEGRPQLLLDAYHPERFGGTGLSADLALAQPVAQHYSLLLAGGLTPETVGAAIMEVRPWGVDVSSGVEKEKGLKDHARVRAFVDAAREGALSV